MLDLSGGGCHEQKKVGNRNVRVVLVNFRKYLI